MPKIEFTATCATVISASFSPNDRLVVSFQICALSPPPTRRHYPYTAVRATFSARRPPWSSGIRHARQCPHTFSPLSPQERPAKETRGNKIQTIDPRVTVRARVYRSVISTKIITADGARSAVGFECFRPCRTQGT